VCELLRPLNIKLLVYDPFATEEDARAIGGELCDLDTIFTVSDVVSLHTPLLDETRGMITGKHFEQMKPDSTFINTARGAVIREDEMIDVLRKRKDIVAVLDVTYPEPPVDDSVLWTLPNVVLTPHIAGATGSGEIREFGVLMLAELDRYLNGLPLQHQITEEQFVRMA
jgi:phosphoglycerate dehydrogenase-like enzyme